MMRTTLVMSDQLAEELVRALREPLETAGVITVRMVVLDTETRLLAREIHWVASDAYIDRTAHGLSIASEGYVPALARAQQRGEACLWFHTHPGETALPLPSKRDTTVDQNLRDLFKLRTESEAYGTIIASPRSDGFVFTGRFEAPGSPDPVAIDRMWIVGDRLRLVPAYDKGRNSDTEQFDRNIRAFGSAIQEMLGSLRVGIVGCGGTGSAVVEQLVRLGVRDFILFDPDPLSLSNTTRVYGSSVSDIGRLKVAVAADNIRRIAPEARCEQVPYMITREAAARKLASCDCIFGCSDDNAGRLVLARISTYFITPVIDCGVLLSSGEQGVLQGIDGRVTVMTPGQPCLTCRGRVDTKRAAAELMTPQERKRLAGEGYAPALSGIEPAVITFTTITAATAVSELLERLVGYGPMPRPSEVLLRLHDREISTNTARCRENHFCHPATGKIGLGMTEPLLEQLWTG